jgi:hypothetical protein
VAVRKYGCGYGYGDMDMEVQTFWKCNKGNWRQLKLCMFFFFEFVLGCRFLKLFDLERENNELRIQYILFEF